MAKKRTKTDIDTLIAELKLDVSQLDELERLNRQAEERILHGATELLDYAAFRKRFNSTLTFWRS